MDDVIVAVAAVVVNGAAERTKAGAPRLLLSLSEEGMDDRGSGRATRKSEKKGPIDEIDQGGHQGGPAALARAGEAGEARSNRPQ